MDNPTQKLYLTRPQRFYSRWQANRKNTSFEIPLIKEILVKYDLDLIGTPKSAIGGSRNKTYIIDTTRGKKIFKRYKESLGKSTIIQEHSILNYLASIGFPAVRLIPTVSGETLLHYDKQRYVLYHYVNGFMLYDYMLFPSTKKKYIAMAGRLLGRLHNALKDFIPQGYNPDGFDRKTGERWRDAKWYQNKLSTCRENAGNGENSGSDRNFSYLVKNTEYLVDSLLMTDSILKEADLDCQIIHKDFGQANVIYRCNNSPIIIDFEIARMDWRIIDLIDGWENFCSGWSGFSLGKMKIFYNAYNNTVRLSENELVFIPIIWKFLNTTKCILFLNKYCETGNKQALKKAYRFFNTIKMGNLFYENLITITGMKKLVIH